MSDDPRRGIDGFDVAIAAMHACGAAAVLEVAFLIFNPRLCRELHESRLLLGLAFGLFFVHLMLGAHWPIWRGRAKITGVILCAFSGLAVGLVWPFILVW